MTLTLPINLAITRALKAEEFNDTYNELIQKDAPSPVINDLLAERSRVLSQFDRMIEDAKPIPMPASW